MRKLAPYIFIFISGSLIVNFIDNIGLAWLIGFITWGITDIIDEKLKQ